MKFVFSLVIVALLAVSLVSAVEPYNCPMGGYGNYGMMTGYGGYGIGMLLAWLFYLGVMGLIGAGIYWLVKSAQRKK